MSQLVICRTCGKKIYNSNAKNLFDTEDNEILAKIHILTGIYINEEQHLPKDICGSCHLDLNHSIAFRERCIKTHKLLLMLNERRRKRANLNALKTAKIKSKKHPQLEIVRVSIEPYHPLIEKKAKKIHTYSKNHIRKSTISEELPSIDQQPNTFCKEESQHDECPKFERSVHLDNDEFSKLTESQAFCEASQNESHIIEHTADSDNEIPDKPKKNPDHRGSKPVATGAKKYVCHHCGRCFADSSNFKVHILRHTGIKDFKCTECGAKFFTRHLLHLHTRVRHLGEKPYACKYCDQRFSRALLAVGMNVQHTREMPYTCRFCGKSYLAKSYLNRHEFLHTGERPYRTCGKRINRLNAKNLFAKDNELLQKIETLTGLWLTDERCMPEKICSYCLLDLDHAIAFRERCININNLLLLRSLHKTQPNPLEKSSKENSDDPLENNDINIKFENEEYDSAEIELTLTHDLPYKIVTAKNKRRENPKSVCNSKSASPKRIKRRILSAGYFHDSHGKQFTDKTSRIRHFKRHFYDMTDDDSNVVLNYHAVDADKSLPVRNSRGISEVSVQTHQKTRSSISSDSLSDEMKLSQVHCRLSGKKIRKLRSYFCDQCGRHFNDKANLNRHLQRHLGVKSFECQECGHKDYSQHLINLHTRIQHQGEKPYACKHCGNRFSNSMARLRHQRGHVEYLAPQVEMPSFTCNLCNKSFTKKTTLDNHAVVHTGEQPFCCETCNVYFNRKSSLRTHYRSKAHQNKATLKLDELGTDSN